MCTALRFIRTHIQKALTIFMLENFPTLFSSHLLFCCSVWMQYECVCVLLGWFACFRSKAIAVGQYNTTSTFARVLIQSQEFTSKAYANSERGEKKRKRERTMTFSVSEFRPSFVTYIRLSSIRHAIESFAPKLHYLTEWKNQYEAEIVATNTNLFFICKIY